MKILKFLPAGCGLLLMALLAPVSVSAQTILSTSYSGIGSASQIVLPGNMNTVVTAVNVGSTTSDTVNGITFQADSTDGPGSTAAVFSGNGYTAFASSETSAGVSGATFTQSTINTGGTHPPLGDEGYVDGDAIIALQPDTEYDFQIYLSDDIAGRGTQFAYSLDGLSGSVDIAQNLGAVNVYSVDFETGANSTFDWSLTATANNHDAKLSGYTLFEAAPAPEPSPLALVALGGAVTVIALRRKKRGSIAATVIGRGIRNGK